MQIGEFIVDRWMVQILRDICAERGIDFKVFSDGWVLEMTSDSKRHRVIGYQFDINDAVAASIAKDKVAAHLLLDDNDVPSVPHVLLRPKVTEEKKHAIAMWGEIVVKPLDGSGGHYVRRFSDVDALVAWIEGTGITAWAAAPFIDIVREIRFVMLDGKPLIVYEKQPVVKDNLKMFNLGLGSVPKDIAPSAALVALAAGAQSALGLRLSAVDIIETSGGEYKVLEVNSGFMMEHYMRFSPENKQRVINTYGKIVDAVLGASHE